MSSPNDGQLLQQLQTELAQKEVALSQQDSLCKDQATKIDALVQQMAEMEDNLNHSYNQTLESLYTSMLQAKEEKEYLMRQVDSLESQMKAAKEEQEKIDLQLLQPAAEDSEDMGDLRERLAEMEKRLEDSDQQMRLLQGSAQEAQDEKRLYRKQELGLQAEILKLKYLLKDKANALVMAKMRSEKVQPAASVPSPFLNSSEELRMRMEELESRLGVSNRLADFLQTNLLKAEEKSDRYKEHKSQMAAELETIKRQLLEHAAQLSLSSETNAKQGSEIQDLLQKLQDAETSLDSNQRDYESKVQQVVESARSGQNELLHKISQLQFHLTESQRFAEFVQSSWNKMKIEKEENEAKSSAAIATLEFKLKEASRVSQFVQQTLKKKANDLQQLELSAVGEKKQLEFNVVEASRITVFLQNKLHEMEKKSSSEIANLHFQLSEANRMKLFLTKNANKIAEIMQKQHDDNVSLEEQLDATRGQLAAAQSALEANDVILDSHKENVTELQQQVGELESRLFVSNQLCDFLKENLSKAEEMKYFAETERDDIETQLSVLTEHSETERKMKIYSYLSQDQREEIDALIEETTDTTRSLSESSDQDSLASSSNADFDMNTLETNDCACQIASLKFRLTESQRLFHFVQSKLQTLEHEKHQQAAEYQAKLAQLEFQATESARVAKFTQKAFSKTAQEKKSIESEGVAEKVNFMFSLSEANRMIAFLSKKLKDTESKYEERIQDLEFRFTESTRVSECQEFVLERLVAKKQRSLTEANEFQSLMKQARQKIDLSSALGNHASNGKI